LAKSLIMGRGFSVSTIETILPCGAIITAMASKCASVP